MLKTEVEITKRGLRFIKDKPRTSCRFSTSKRGEIRGFNRHSSLRLREALYRYTVSDCLQISFTFTVPWSVKFFDGDFDLYRDCWASFRHRFSRAFPNSAVIFRHEMQTRKVPHTHAVVYASLADLPCWGLDQQSFNEAMLAFVYNRLLLFWVKALKSTLREGRLESFLDFGVSCSLIYDKLTLMRYVADHSSKHKSEQLGYRGKQWGFIGRENLIRDGSFQACFSNTNELHSFVRTVRRLSVYHRPKKGCPFGCKRGRLRSPRSISFVPFVTVLKYAKFVNRDRLRHGRPIAVKFRRLFSSPPSSVPF